MQHHPHRFGFALAFIVGAVFVRLSSVSAQHEIGSAPAGYHPRVAEASDEGLRALQHITAPEGLKVDLVAAEPHLANPVAFTFDERGRIFVAETFRHHAGVGDIRGRMDWLDDELASRSVDDRFAYMQHRLGSRAADWARESERVKLLEDRDGDGVFDHSTVFAENFNTLLDGIGAGLLARKGDVYFACMPNLWLLRDANQNGVADYRRSLHFGYGVRVGFLGHDLHGLKIGPDGKLYFSSGDRGASIRTASGTWVGNPDQGDVFRCNLDGSELEVFASGLRNPQELAFDQYGNLFTGDNNSDGGDRARWVYLVEGGDSGWRVGYQFLNDRGPFNREKIWHPAFAGQAAYFLPPITNISAGPSGLTYYPGTGLPAGYEGKFFLVDFRGSQQSEIHTFNLEPQGASFALVNAARFTTGFQPTDAEFGVDGGLYVSDWVRGWDKNGKGRIYRFHDPAVNRSPIVQQTKTLIGEGMEKRSARQLIRLLEHPDMRVRQEAQFELAGRGLASVRLLAAVASRHDSQLARLHAIWGLGQIGNSFKGIAPRTPGWPAVEPLLRLTGDADAEVRAQVARTLGDLRVAEAYQPLLNLTVDPSERVRFFATMGLGKLRRSEAVPAVLAVLRANADQDRYLRHAAVMALTWIHDTDALLAAANDASSSVRLGALLAMRRLQRPEIAGFLDDSDPFLVAEAARAINDEPVNGGMWALAGLLRSPERVLNMERDLQDPILRRAINAGLRVGTNDLARVLAQFAANSAVSETLRAEALGALADWESPSGRDRVLSLWRPVASRRDPRIAVEALQPMLVGLLKDAPGAIRMAAIQAVEKLRMADADDTLEEIVAHDGAPGNARLAALRALASLNSSRLPTAVEKAAASELSSLRNEATRLRARLALTDPVALLEETLAKGTDSEKQNALATLAGVQGEKADGVIARWLDRLLAGEVAPTIQLDVLESAAKRESAALAEKVGRYEASLAGSGELAPFRMLLQGGDAEAGRRVFMENQAAACLKCHKYSGEGGEVGPDLAGIGGRQNREYILEGIVLPNKAIAPGYENVLVTTRNGTVLAGIIKSETETELTLNSAEDGLMTLKKSDITKRERGPSSMPEEMHKLISRQEIRDLVEFLAQSK